MASKRAVIFHRWSIFSDNYKWKTKGEKKSPTSNHRSSLTLCNPKMKSDFRQLRSSLRVCQGWLEDAHTPGSAPELSCLQVKPGSLPRLVQGSWGPRRAGNWASSPPLSRFFRMVSAPRAVNWPSQPGWMGRSSNDWHVDRWRHLQNDVISRMTSSPTLPSLGDRP